MNSVRQQNMLEYCQNLRGPSFFSAQFCKEGDMPQQFVTITQAIEILNISRPTIHRKLKAGDIPSIHLGKRILIPTEFFQRLQDEAFGIKAAEKD